MADPKDSASKAAIPLELLKVEAAFVKRAVTSSSGKRSKGQGAPSYKRDVMYAASKHHLNDGFTHSGVNPTLVEVRGVGHDIAKDEPPSFDLHPG